MAIRRIESATTAIRAILPLDILWGHKKYLLKICLGKLTEADGKYDTRYFSKNALRAAKADQQHDHVIRREHIIQELHKHPNSVEEILAGAIGCVVTKAEHRALTAADCVNPAIEGWERYKQAGVTVVDRMSGEELNLTPDAEQPHDLPFQGRNPSSP